MSNSNIFESLLSYFNISLEEYKYLTREVDLTNFFEDHYFDSGVDTANFVKEAINQQNKIIVYGDYDADGIMGTSILVKLFKYLNYEVSYYIPNRYNDGYGININKAKEIVDKGFNLVICVDNGISAFEAIDYLKAHNVKVVVLDHHEKQGELPNADCIMHPTISNFGEIASSGAFTALFFSYYMLGYMDKYLATLASISLITDMMPLKSYNRDLLRAIISSYKKFEFLSIDLLLEGNKFDANSIGMVIGPRINAIGRLFDDESINDIVKYFISDDRNFILNYFNVIVENNNLRKELTQSAINELNLDKQDYVIKVLDNVKEGLIGLVAGHISNRYNIPSIILTSNDGDTYKSSARSPEGFNMFEAFLALKDHLLAFGGHAQAGGFSIRKDELMKFEQDFDKFYQTHPYEKVEKPSINISITDINKDTLDIIDSFSPFGESWKAPKLKLQHLKTDSLRNSKNGTAIRTPIGYNTFILGFNMNKDTFINTPFINAIGHLRENEFMGRKNIEFIIDEWDIC